MINSRSLGIVHCAKYGMHRGKWFIYIGSSTLPKGGPFDTEQDARNWAAGRGIEL